MPRLNRPVRRNFAAATASVVTATSLVMAASLGGLASVAGAAASGPGAFQLTAQGDALAFSIAGTKLVGGDSTISADTTPNADAQGSGQLLPSVSGSQHATASASGQDQNLPQTCASPAIPPPLDTYLSAGLGCGSAQAAVDGNGLPNAGSSGSVASLTIGAGTALTQLIQAGTPVYTTLQSVLGQLPALPAGGSRWATCSPSWVYRWPARPGWPRSAAGTSTGSVSATSATATATNTSSGATIDLLPGAGLDNLPLASITVGAAKATATLDRTGGAGTATANRGRHADHQHSCRLQHHHHCAGSVPDAAGRNTPRLHDQRRLLDREPGRRCSQCLGAGSRARSPHRSARGRHLHRPRLVDCIGDRRRRPAAASGRHFSFQRRPLRHLLRSLA